MILLSPFNFRNPLFYCFLDVTVDTATLNISYSEHGDICASYNSQSLSKGCLCD